MFQNDQEAISYIESQRVKRSLEDYKKILEKYDIATNELYFIHVTGTNGKGSTVQYLRRLLNAAGKKVGTFTSPYMISYHDRFCIDGEPISSEALLMIANQYESVIVGEKLSKFEIDVLIMLIYFKLKKVDYAIVEVGIGGRYDKTNVIDSKLSLITNIGYDHMPSLGTTLKEVAYHKAGIIKSGSTVITTINQEECLNEIVKEAKDKKATLLMCPRIYHPSLCFSYRGISNIDLGDVAYYQLPNAILALEAFFYLNIPLSEDKIKEALYQLSWPGRFEKIVYKNRDIYIDGAHNRDGIRALKETIQQKRLDPIVIFSALKDKDYKEMISCLSQDFNVIITSFDDERQMDLSEFPNHKVFPCFEKALNEAFALSKDIVVTGSLHFISAVRKYLKNGS